MKNIISIKKIILAALLPLAFSAGDPSDPIRETREHYYAVGAKIEACRQAEVAGCELYLDAQGKLLRFMEGSQVKRLGEPARLELLKAESKRLQRQFLSAHGLN